MGQFFAIKFLPSRVNFKVSAGPQFLFPPGPAQDLLWEKKKICMRSHENCLQFSWDRMQIFFSRCSLPFFQNGRKRSSSVEIACDFLRKTPGPPKIPWNFRGTGFPPISILFSQIGKSIEIRGNARLPSKIVCDFRRENAGPPKIRRIFGGQGPLRFLWNRRRRRISPGTFTSIGARRDREKKDLRRGWPDQRSYKKGRGPFLYACFLRRKQGLRRRKPDHIIHFFLLFYTPVFSAESKVFGEENPIGPPFSIFLSSNRKKYKNRRKQGFPPIL